MAYDETHRSFIQHHIANRKGERRGRPERGHGHAEALFLRNVWWLLRGDFQHLHPEYESIGVEDHTLLILHGCREWLS